MSTIINKNLIHKKIGVEIEDRTWRLRKYKKTFVGKTAVRWMLQEGIANTTEEAIQIGNRLMTYGYIKHILEKFPFENSNKLYQFYPGDRKSVV